MLLWFITLFSYSHNICANMYVCVFILDICFMEKPIELQESIQYCSNLLVLLCLTTRPQGQLNKSVLFSCSSLRFKIERGSWKQRKLMRFSIGLFLSSNTGGCNYYAKETDEHRQPLKLWDRCEVFWSLREFTKETKRFRLGSVTVLIGLCYLSNAEA